MSVMVHVTAVSGMGARTNGETSSGAGGLVSGKSRALGVVGAGLGDVANDPVLASSAEDLGVSWVGLDAVFEVSLRADLIAVMPHTQRRGSSRLVE